MNPGELVTVSLVGDFMDDLPGIDEETGSTLWVKRGTTALYLGPQVGQITLGGGARILWNGRLVLVMPGALTPVQQGEVSV